tara:strand:+ start:185 stop:382 length:198 start_codon:yes stop_codon:yes gene_type:complete
MDIRRIQNKLDELRQQMEDRNRQLKLVAPILGADFSFSDEEIIKDLEEKIAKYMEKEFINRMEGK